MPELKCKEITEKIIGASFEVQKFLGNRCQGLIYQRALAWDFAQAGLSFVREIGKKYFTKSLLSLLEQEGLILLWKGKYWLS